MIERERERPTGLLWTFSDWRLLPRQGQPGSHGTQHALLLGPETEERWTRSRVPAEVRLAGKRPGGPGRRDGRHREHRTEEVL